MYVSQFDIAQLTDDDVKRLAVQASEYPHPFWQAVSRALVVMPSQVVQAADGRKATDR